MSAIVTLTTDFGVTSPYVAEVKGVLLGAVPELRIVDVTHAIPAYDIGRAELVLRRIVRSFPTGTVHLVVVDPGVGSARRPIAVALGGQLFVGPDNGVLGPVLTSAARIVVLDKPFVFRRPMAPTFHARDLFAPVVAELASGVSLFELGSEIFDPRAGTLPQPRLAHGHAVGVTLAADDFGNLATNIPGDHVRPSMRVRLAGRELPRVSTYAEAELGRLVALVGSDGYLEIAMRERSAALELQGGVGLEIVCE